MPMCLEFVVRVLRQLQALDMRFANAMELPATHGCSTLVARIPKCELRLALYCSLHFRGGSMECISREPKIITPFISFIHHV